MRITWRTVHDRHSVEMVEKCKLQEALCAVFPSQEHRFRPGSLLPGAQTTRTCAAVIFRACTAANSTWTTSGVVEAGHGVGWCLQPSDAGANNWRARVVVRRVATNSSGPRYRLYSARDHVYVLAFALDASRDLAVDGAGRPLVASRRKLRLDDFDDGALVLDGASAKQLTAWAKAAAAELAAMAKADEEKAKAAEVEEAARAAAAAEKGFIDCFLILR